MPKKYEKMTQKIKCFIKAKNNKTDDHDDQILKN